MELRDYLKQTLTASQFENLASLMEVTPTRKTQMLNNPESMSIEEVLKLAAIINHILTPGQLILQFHCGWDVGKISINTLNYLLHAENRKTPGYVLSEEPGTNESHE